MNSRPIIPFRAARALIVAAMTLGLLAVAGPVDAAGTARSAAHQPAPSVGRVARHPALRPAGLGRAGVSTYAAHATQRPSRGARVPAATWALRLAPTTRRAILHAPALSAGRLPHGGVRPAAGTPNIICPPVWEGPPYLNRYATYQDNGQGQCLPTGNYLIQPTIITGTLALTSAAYLEDSFTVASGAQLTVPAGATILTANPDCCNTTAIYVAGVLSMSGSATNPISVTTEPGLNGPGAWGGVSFWPGGSGALAYVHMSYGGRRMACDGNGCSVSAGLSINNGTQTSVSVAHTTVDYSSGNGLEINGSTPALAALTLDDNANWAVQYDNVMPTGTLDAPGVVTGGGNGHNGVLVTNLPNNCISCSGATLAGTMAFVHAPLDNVEIDGSYVITAGAKLSLGASLGPITLNPGCAGGIAIQPGGSMSVGAGNTIQVGAACYGTAFGIYNQGTLTMNGTAGQPISMTSSSPTPGPGYWQGVGFWPGSSGALSYVHLSYAGGNTNCGGNGCSGTAGLLINAANVSVDHTTIDYSHGHGLEIAGGATPALSALTLNGNTDWAVQYDFLPASGTLDDPAAVSGSGNGTNGVLVTAGGAVSGNLSIVTGSLDTVQIAGPLTVNAGAQLSIAAGVPLAQFSAFGCTATANLTVDPGAQMTVGAGANLEFSNNCGSTAALYVAGTLSAIGSAGQPITMTGTTNVSGAWGGLVFLPGGGGALSYVHLSYAGSGGTNCGGNGCSGRAGIEANNANPTISFTTIDNSGGNDVEVSGGGLPVLHNDAFEPVPGGSFGVVNDNGQSGPTVDARQDWWSDPSGPSGPGGSGTGVPVSLGVNFTPWLGASPTAPQLMSSSAGGRYRDTVVITGTNFSPSETVKVYWDSVNTPPLTTTTSAGDGSFVAVVTVPQAISGAHSIIAVGQSSFKSASTPFTISPETFLRLSSGVQGSPDDIVGYGFGSYEAVTVLWDTPRGPMLGSGVTDVLGTFAGPLKIAFTVPMSPTGTYGVYAVGQSSNATAFSTFKLNAALSVSPNGGAPGSSATVAGTGFGARETVTVKWDCSSRTCSSHTVLGTAHTDANGDFSGLSVTIPSGAPAGAHTVGAIGSRSHAFASAQFNVT